MAQHSLVDHGHRHVYLGAGHDANERRTRWVVALTAVMMIVEIAAGIVTGSMALLADGLHMATHAGALTIAAVAYAYARRQAHSPRYSFGTGKVGDLAGFASAIILGLFAAGIGVESVARLVNPGAIAFGDAILVAVIGLVVNLVSAWLLGGGPGHDHHDHAHGHDHDHDHAHQDNNLRSAYLHVLADALTSVMAILALLGGRYLGWVWLDPVIGILGAIVIMRWSWTLMRDTAAILLDETAPALAAEVHRALADEPGEIVDLHVWRIAPGAHAAMVTLVVPDLCDPGPIRARLSAIAGLAHVTVETTRCDRPHG